jgi:hypothetical protein
MPLPNAPHVSLREAVLWIAYGDAKPRVDLSGDGLWFNQEKEVVDARAALWFALENGSLEASALGPDGTPATIAKHEWRFLFGRCVPKYSFERGSFERRQGDDGLYVKGKFPHWLSMSGVDGPPRFTTLLSLAIRYCLFGRLAYRLLPQLPDARPSCVNWRMN